MAEYNILFVDNGRQDEINTFYDACQLHRDYYRGYRHAHHPLTYFNEPKTLFQCADDLTPTYLSYPMYHVKYKQPAVLPNTTGRTSGIPDMPERTLAGRYNKAPCKLYVR